MVYTERVIINHSQSSGIAPTRLKCTSNDDSLLCMHKQGISNQFSVRLSICPSVCLCLSVPQKSTRTSIIGHLLKNTLAFFHEFYLCKPFFTSPTECTSHGVYGLYTEIISSTGQSMGLIIYTCEQTPVVYSRASWASTGQHRVRVLRTLKG